MSIDLERRESRSRVLLSRSLRPCQVTQSSEVAGFPGRIREASLQLQGRERRGNLALYSTLIFKKLTEMWMLPAEVKRNSKTVL